MAIYESKNTKIAKCQAPQTFQPRKLKRIWYTPMSTYGTHPCHLVVHTHVILWYTPMSSYGTHPCHLMVHTHVILWYTPMSAYGTHPWHHMVHTHGIIWYTPMPSYGTHPCHHQQQTITKKPVKVLHTVRLTTNYVLHINVNTYA